MVWGFLRETKEDAAKAGIDKDTGLCRTGLEEYLKVIYPDVDDWIHDKPTGIRGRFSDPFLFAVKDAVDDSVRYSGESGKLAEARSLFEAGEYNHAA